MPTAVQTRQDPERSAELTGAPEWGASVRTLWSLDAATRALNHGAFGATPAELGEEQLRWRARMERNPARFFMTELPGLLREAATAVAGFVGTTPDRLAFTTNASAGTSAVLWSLRLEPGDEVLTTDHVYNAVRNQIRHAVERAGARAVEAPVGMPVTDPAAIVEAIARGLSPRTRLVVVDHVASASAVTFPVAEVAALCRDRGVPCLVDGAHAPGLLDLDVDAIGADWYVGNCHKWLCGPKSAAFIAVADRPTPVVHPVVVSHAYGQGFTAEFDKVGTHDPSAALTAPAAIALHERLGGARLRRRNRALALSAAAEVARELGTELGAAAELFQAMATVRLPGDLPATREVAAGLHDDLYDRHRIEAAITAVAGRLYLRISAQAYNSEADYAGLGAAVREAVDAVSGARR